MFKRTSSKARRLGSAAMGIGVMALGVVVSPLATGSAYAAPSCGVDGVLCGNIMSGYTGSTMTDVAATGGAGSAVKLTNNYGSPNHWMFVPSPSGNGAFTIRVASSGLCLDTTNNSDSAIVQICSGQSSQDWYAQPLQTTNTGYEQFRFRRASDNKCLNAWGGGTSAGTTVGLWNCQGSSAWNDRFAIGKYGSGQEHAPELVQQLKSWATMYALNQFNNKSSVIPTATFQVGTPAPAKSGPAQVVGPPAFAGASGSVYQYGWSHSTGYTFSNGGSVTVTGTVGTGPLSTSPVAASISVAIQGYWGSQWNTTTTQSGQVQFDIPPGQVGWVARAQLLKAMTGTWSIINDKGDSWQGTGTATVPAADGTDSPSNASVLYQCTTNPSAATWAEACYKTVPNGYPYPATRPSV
ncbi:MULTISPECIES: RICIN domain-containing protein [unclassified Streptomyces]|uniref:RICIN domain-containing protein n=1 Tax=unclassified Streptomyces TaxID=2593676 RepID=UPI0009A10544|nr:RICIN domain-containing protein [Streptomyces sp. TSRI0281]